MPSPAPGCARHRGPGGCRCNVLPRAGCAPWPRQASVRDPPPARPPWARAQRRCPSHPGLPHTLQAPSSTGQPAAQARRGPARRAAPGHPPPPPASSGESCSPRRRNPRGRSRSGGGAAAGRSPPPISLPRRTWRGGPPAAPPGGPSQPVAGPPPPLRSRPERRRP